MNAFLPHLTKCQIKSYKMILAFLISTTLALLVTTTSLAQTLPMAEHQMLKMDEGVWQANISMWENGNITAQYRATETNFMIGELWSVGKLEGKIASANYSGFATLGYDPIQGQYVGTWVDSLTPEITQMQGTYDEKSKTLTLFYTVSGKNNQAQQYRNIMVYKDSNTRDFVMSIKTNDIWLKAMEISYQRIH